MSYVLFPSTIKPTGPFPSHEDTFGKGGFVALTGQTETLTNYETISEFLNTEIPTLRRKVGMLAYVSSINQYYTCSSITGENGISGDWSRQYFSGRYFHGPTAPEVNDIQVGERWFDTVAGTEYTYIPIEEGSTYNAWVDIDHLGGGGVGTMTYFYGTDAPDGVTVGSKWFNSELGAELTYLPNPPDSNGETGYVWVMVNSLAAEGQESNYFYGSTAPLEGLTLGDKWFNTIVGSEFTYLPSDPNETNYVWVDIDHIDSVVDNYVKKTGDTMSGTLTGINASFTGFSASNGFIGTLTGTNASLSSLTASNGFIGTLTGTNASFTGITATNGFIGTLTGNYINIPSLGAFGSQIRVASNNSLGMPYYSGSMNSLDLWSRLHLIGGGGATGYSLRITTSTVGSTVEGSQGKMIFDQGSTYGVAIVPYGLTDINDGSGGISIFATDLRTGNSNLSDPSMNYDGSTGSNNWYGMLTLETDGKGYIPRMFSTRKTDLQDTFSDNEFVTKRISLTRPLPQTNSTPIVFNQEWAPNIAEDDFLFCSLTERKLGFKFPVDISVRWAAGIYALSNGGYSSNFRIGNFNGVYPRAGTTISIYVDRDLAQPSAGNSTTLPAGFSGGNVNTDIINIAGYLEGNQSIGKITCFLDVRPSATGQAGN